MTDQELLARLQEHGAADLTPEELELLRTRLPVSSELQQAVFSEVALEEVVAAALGRPDVTAETVLRRAGNSPARKWAARLGWMVTVLLIAGGLTWWLQKKPPAAVPPRTIAKAAPKKKSVKTAEPEKVIEKQDEQPKPEETKPEAVAPAPQPVPQVVAKPPMPAVPVETAPATPWPELDAKKNPPRPLAETSFVDVVTQPGISLQELRRWIEPVPGQPSRFFEEKRNNVPCSGFEGVVRLKPKWAENAVLRVAPFDCEAFALHFWAGDQGVSFICHLQPTPRWSGYLGARQGVLPRPVRWTMAGTDDGRYDRTGAGPIEVRYQDGLVVLSRGPVRLMSLPLPQAPQDVFFDRRASFRSFTMYLGEPLPDDLLPQGNSVLAELPSSMKWEPQAVEDTRFEVRDDGTVRLSAEKKAETVRAFVRLPRMSLYEFIVQVEDPAAGAGVYFGDEKGQPLQVLGFTREKQTGWTMFGPYAAAAPVFESLVEMGHKPALLSHGRHWLRVVFGSGMLKLSVSGDGRHWSNAVDPVRNLRGGISTIGLVCFTHTEPRGITLRSLQARELTTLTDLAAADLRDDVPEAVRTHTGELSTWLAAVCDTQPIDAEPTEWRMVCAIQTLASVPPSKLGNLILNGLLEELLAQPKPLEDRLKLLVQVAELFDAWEAPECYRLVRQYERLGRLALAAGNHKPWSDVGQKLLTAPIVTPAKFSVFPLPLLREELYRLMYDDDLPAADDVCDRIRFFSQPSHPELAWTDPGVRLLVDWIQGTSEPPGLRRPGQKGRPAPRRPNRQSAVMKFRHPLVVELSKEGYNTLGEVQSALSEGAWKEACQIISTVNLSTATGLLPDASDNHLLVSLPQAVDVAMRDFPLLKQHMVEEFGPTARLRVHQAIADGNAPALEAAAVQFHGTEAAAHAHRWLGDRWLAAGEFGRAAAAFQEALSTAPLDQRVEIQSRLRLTAALLGREMGDTAGQPIQFNDVQLTPGEFEQLVNDLRLRAGSTSAKRQLVAVEPPPLVHAPAAVRYEVAARIALPGDKGKNPGAFPPGEADALGSQYAGQVVGDMLYLSNRFAILAIDLTTNAVKWNCAIGGEQGDTHGWHLTPMKPVVAGDRLFARRISTKGPELVALDIANGNIVWKKLVPDLIVSDPVVVQDSVLVLTATGGQDGLLHLALSALHPQTGDVRSQRPLIRLIDAWGRQVPCELSLTGGRLIAAVGGSVLCCDVTGQVLWVRRQTWLPLSHEPSVWDQAPVLPVVADERIVLSQPGVMAVECLESSCGRRLWQAVVPDLRRVVGVSANHVLVEGDKRLLGLSIVDGQTVWESPVERFQRGTALAGDGQVLAVRTERFRDADPGRPWLTWLDARTGREQACWPLEPLQEKLPRIGPLYPHKDRVLCVYGKHEKDLDRELAILKPGTAAAFARKVSDHPLRTWIDGLADRRVSLAVDCVLPEWLCLGTADDPAAGLMNELRGQKDVCATLAASDRPVTLIRRVTVPEGKTTRLDLTVGCQPNEAWTLDVRVPGRSLETVRIEDSATPNGSGWKDLRLDLTPYAGRTVTLLVEQQFSGKPAHAYWKKLDVVSE